MAKTKFMKVRATEEEQAAWIAYAKQHDTDFSKLVREMMEGRLRIDRNLTEMAREDQRSGLL